MLNKNNSYFHDRLKPVDANNDKILENVINYLTFVLNETDELRDHMIVECQHAHDALKRWTLHQASKNSFEDVEKYHSYNGLDIKTKNKQEEMPEYIDSGGTVENNNKFICRNDVKKTDVKISLGNVNKAGEYKGRDSTKKPVCCSTAIKDTSAKRSNSKYSSVKKFQSNGLPPAGARRSCYDVPIKSQVRRRASPTVDSCRSATNSMSQHSDSNGSIAFKGNMSKLSTLTETVNLSNFKSFTVVIETIDLYKQLQQFTKTNTNRASASRFKTKLKERTNDVSCSLTDDSTFVDYTKWIKMKARCYPKNKFDNNNATPFEWESTDSQLDCTNSNLISEIYRTELMFVQVQLLKILNACYTKPEMHFPLMFFKVCEILFNVLLSI